MSWDLSRKKPWKSLCGVESGILSRKREESSWSASSSDTSSDLSEKDARSISEREDDILAAKQTNMFGGTRLFLFTDLARVALFGGCVGTLTGSGFGFMDSMRTVQESPKLKTLSNSGKGDYIFKGVTRNGLLFGGFFSGFHSLKYIIRTYVQPGDWGEIFGAGVLSLGAVGYKPSNRPAIPYCFMLVAMDTFQLLFRDEEKGGGKHLGIKAAGTGAN